MSSIREILDQQTKDLRQRKVIISGNEIQEGWYRDLCETNRIGVVATAQAIICLHANKTENCNFKTELNTLSSFVLPDGSFPFISNINSIGVTDSTAWACLAFILCNPENAEHTELTNKALEWLASNQNEDGGWGLVSGERSRTVSTSIALRALQSHHLDSEKLEHAHTRGLKYILSTQLGSGAWANQAGTECLGATSYALISLSETENKDSPSLKKAASFILSKLDDENLWDNETFREEISIYRNNAWSRVTFTYPVTHLCIRGILACGHAEKMPRSTIEKYIKKVASNFCFSGENTDSGKPTSYGRHDLIMALIEANKITHKTQTETSEFENYTSINPSNYPRIYHIAGKHNAPVDVIFIHGLEGDAKQTWLNTSTNFYLPHHVAKNTGARTFVVGYKNPASRWTGAGMSLDERSENLLHLFERDSLLKRKTILVGHSFGGLLIKKIVVSLNSTKTRRSLLEKISGASFIATPHYGSKLASFADMLGGFFRGTHAIKNLIHDNEQLVTLNRDYKNISSEYGIKNQSFAENQKKILTKIVSKTSADLGMPLSEHIVIDADHIEISKPSDPHALISKSLCDFVKRIT